VTSKSNPDDDVKRTNNGPESFHSHYNEQFYTRHLTIYIFIDVIEQIQSITYIIICFLDTPATQVCSSHRIVTFYHFKLLKHRDFFFIPTVLFEMSLNCVFLVLYEIINKCSSIYLLVSDEILSLKMLRNTGKTLVNSALLNITFPLKCKTLQVKIPLRCCAPAYTI
jgi:hypothetical protein